MTPNVVNIIPVPCRLIANPANLNSPPNYGGTPLGIHRDLEFVPEVKHYPIRAEEFGHVPIDILYCGQAAYLKGYARGYDPDNSMLLWPYDFLGGSGKAVLFDTPTTTSRAGLLLSSESFKLLVAPLDNVNHPAIIIYRAVPAIPDDLTIPLARNVEFAYPFAFRGIPDSTGRAYVIGLMSDLSL